MPSESAAAEARKLFNAIRSKAQRHVAVVVNAPKSIDELQEGLNEAFEFVATELPRLSVELATLMSLGADDSGDTSVARLSDAKASLTAELGRAMSWLQKSQSELQDVLGELRPGVARMLQVLSEVRREARELRVLALNASFVAQQGGEGMRGFVAATTELITIAAEQLSGAEQVIEVVERLGRRFEDLEGIGKEFTAQADSIATLSAEAALASVIAALAELDHQVAALAAEGRGVSENVGRLMVAIQRQDILRQGLDHVRLVAKEISASIGVLEHSAAPDFDGLEALQAAELLRCGSGLCADLLDSILGELDEFLGEVHVQLGTLVAMSAAGNDRSSIGMTADLRGYSEALHRGVALLAESLGRRTDSHSRKSQVLSELGTGVSSLPARIHQFVERQEQVRTLGILIRRQDAHMSRGLDGARAIIEALDALFTKDGGHWQETLQDATRLRHKTRAIGHPESEARAGSDAGILMELSELSSLIARSTKQAELAEEGARRAVVGTAHIAHRMLARLVQLKERLDKYRELEQSYRALGSVGEELTAVLSLGAKGPIELPDRLRELISKFTILSHKRLATRFSSTSLGEGDEGGSITLF